MGRRMLVALALSAALLFGSASKSFAQATGARPEQGAAAATPPAAAAQAPGTPSTASFAGPLGCNGAVTVDTLSARYQSGDSWSMLQSDLKKLLGDCLTVTATDSSPVVVSIVVSQTPARVLHVVVPEGQPCGTTLLGVSSFTCVVLVKPMSQSKTPPRCGVLVHAAAESVDIECRLVRETDCWSGRRHPGLFGDKARQGRPTRAHPLRLRGRCHQSAVQARDGRLCRGRSTIGDQASPVTVADTVTLTNTPRTRAAFTAAASYIVHLRGDENVKVSGSTYASSPLSRAMTMAAIAIHPKAYDSSLSNISGAERFSFLLGGVLTPAAGGAVGISFGLMRGMAINAGLAILVVSKPSAGSVGGAAPATGQSQLVVGHAQAIFLGGSYLFGQ